MAFDNYGRLIPDSNAFSVGSQPQPYATSYGAPVTQSGIGIASTGTGTSGSNPFDFFGQNIADSNVSTDLLSQGTDAFTQAGGAGGSIFDNFLSTNKQQGWGSPAFQGLGALTDAWTSFQNVGIAKDQLDFQKNAFNQQFNEQKRLQDEYRTDRTAARDAAFA